MTDKPKVVMIVEETIQHAYLVDATDRRMMEIVEAMKQLAARNVVEGIPMAWDRPNRLFGKRASKAPLMPNITLREFGEPEANYKTLTKLTVVYPDEDGRPALEQVVTHKTFNQKPVKE